MGVLCFDVSVQLGSQSVAFCINDLFFLFTKHFSSRWGGLHRTLIAFTLISSPLPLEVGEAVVRGQPVWGLLYHHQFAPKAKGLQSF
jgi:hypothetical protein